MRERPNALVWGASVALVVVAAAVTAALVVMLLRPGRVDVEPAGPTLSREVTLRVAPFADADPIAIVSAGAPVLLAARSPDGAWYMVELAGSDRWAGWAPAEAIAGAEGASELPVVVVGTEPAPAGSAAPTQTADLPDLIVEAVYSRDNRLVVVIANEGNADVAAPITITVGGVPHAAGVAGKPLRPGDQLETTLDDEYVQRRASVVIEVSAEGVEEDDTANNRRTFVVTPDIANDLEVIAVELDAPAQDGTTSVRITVRNNSVTPIVGTATIAIRRVTPSNELLARFDEPLEIAAGATHVYEERLPDPGGDVADLQVILSSDAINDANPANDVYPR